MGLSKGRVKPMGAPREKKKNGKEELRCRQLGVNQSDLLCSKTFCCQFFFLLVPVRVWPAIGRGGGS